MNDEIREMEGGKDMALVSAITKAELDQQITTARAFPRSLKRFVNECMDMACLSEEVAANCLYALPRGKDEKGNVKVIEGPSARLAEIIQSAWGNNRSGQRIVDEGDQFVTAQGVFHDLERNVMVTVEVKRRITNSEGRRFNTDMIGVTGNAAASIAHRNAVLKGVPRAFWNEIYMAARKTAVGDAKTLVAKRTDAIAYLQKMGVLPDQIFAALGVEGEADIGLDELAALRGSIAAIKSGELSIEAAFAPKETAEPQAQPKTGKPKTKQPEPKRQPNPQPQRTAAVQQKDRISQDQATVIRDKLKEEGVAESLFLAKLSLGKIEELPGAQYAKAIKLIDELSEA